MSPRRVRRWRPIANPRLRERHRVDLRATNLFSNDRDKSNGLVKAYAEINTDGTIAASWRCNTDPLETQRLATGSHEVDFTLLAIDTNGAAAGGPAITGMVCSPGPRAVGRYGSSRSSTILHACYSDRGARRCPLRPDHLLMQGGPWHPRSMRHFGRTRRLPYYASSTPVSSDHSAQWMFPRWRFLLHTGTVSSYGGNG
jgi:hypothetical protein